MGVVVCNFGCYMHMGDYAEDIYACLYMITVVYSLNEVVK